MVNRRTGVILSSTAGVLAFSIAVTVLGLVTGNSIVVQLGASAIGPSSVYLALWLCALIRHRA